MCGIFGQYSRSGAADMDALVRMQTCLHHRGPDARGITHHDGVALGNVRLSIIDLSEASNQPVFNDDETVALVQNGEIYNYIELREELIRLGHHFATNGDTEVLLHAYLEWGPDFVTRLNGMFVIAVHDRRDGVLHLYRDRLGVKPLFLSQSRDGWIFGSEIKALLAAGVSAEPDMDALAQFFALAYIPPPETGFRRVRHLMPGTRMTISGNGAEIKRYWSLDGIAADPEMTEQDAKAELLSILEDATRIRLRADAQFGAFLSGGLDSSSVVGLMARHLDDPVRTFSIGFDDSGLDETPYALAASARFGTVHRSEVAQPDITQLWPRFIYHCDQPHQDVSFMPMDMVSRLAARDVKMVLTGDGGDELFAGYTKYLTAFPGGGFDKITPGWDRTYARATGLLTGDEPDTLLAGHLHQAFHDRDPYRAFLAAMRTRAERDPINKVLHGDTAVLLPGNNLVKPDRMAMANSMEVRSPFLDYRMAEFSFRVPGAMKLAGGETKAIYKAAVLDLLGPELTYRKKQMFTVPIGEWFKQALAGYCRSMLLDGRLEARGLFKMDQVSQMLDAHITGTQNHTRALRALISVELWYRLFQDRDPDTLAQAGAAT